MVFQNRCGTGKVGRGAASLRKCETEPGSDRIDGFVEFMAPQGKSGLQPQRVARAEAGKADRLIRKKAFRKGNGGFGGNGYFEPVLAGIAGTGDDGVDAVDIEAADLHEEKAV